MSDLIRRFDAIDAISKRIKQIGYDRNPDVLSIRQAVRDVPSAEPERKDEAWLPVVRDESDEEFEGCYDCVYTDDPIEICVIKRCMHAISYLKECYRPKKEGEK